MLSIVAYLDGSPGHDKQTRAILRALGEMTPVEVRFIALPAETGSLRLCRWFIHFCTPARRGSVKEDVDLIIGAGRKTHLSMLRHKKNLSPRPRVIVCMAPGRLLIDRFDLCFVPRHDSAKAAENILRTIGPPCLPVNKRRHGKEKGLILVGGIDEKSHFWESEKIVGRVKALLDRSGDGEWTVSSSRRTPEKTVRRLESVVAERKRGVFFRAENTPSGWIEAQYDLNMTVWVTADSVSMVYEALAAGCRVGVLPVEWKRKNNKFERGLSFLREKNYIRFYDEWLAGDDFPAESAELNEASRCAREILRRWWPERLPSR
jgi:uncharacterized protein